MDTKTRTPAQTELLGICLVVDDCDEVREALKQMISQIGYDVLPATNGKHALEVMGEANAAINMAVVDMQMPELDGVETIRRLRRRLPRCPALMISGKERSYFENELDRLHGCAFLKKPFSLASLKKTLESLEESSSNLSSSETFGNLDEPSR